ncbi:MAG: tRNA uridine-5-carboxymethylaminomethyl(34) synthesis GTPase MnmE [Firmicutes bacterium]|nr:tRNA uridine-5-carboxymethylaminomethyl(34) synthesis GTPase MnmE [Bacillota bacterium]
MNTLFKTVAAISTPHGTGGIAVVRISGDEALEVASRVFFPVSGMSITEAEGSRAYYGKIKYNGEVIDDGIATVFLSPRSFTGEDTVEISCHGGVLLTARVLEAVLSAGALPAPAGEFTRRAFLSGKLTLSEAEAVGERLYAKTDAQLRLSSPDAAGKLSAEVSEISARVMSLLSSLSAVIDYPDEELTVVGRDEAVSECEGIRGGISRLSASYKTGKALSCGVKTAIIGRPNAGKSTLFNLFTGEASAIVTDIAGTTRDVLTAEVTAHDVLLTISDTAGIRETDDLIESMGVERARREAGAAELILWVIDSASDEPLECEIPQTDAVTLAVINKTDAAGRETLEKIKNALAERSVDYVEASLLSGGGFEKIKDFIREKFTDGTLSVGRDAIISSARQASAANEALEYINSALTALGEGLPADIIVTELEGAYGALCQIDGREVTGDVVDEIFSKFCVGK